MDKERQLTGEVLLYGIFLSVAIGFRLILLGQTPLVDSEASLALQALRISEGDAQAIGSRVLYLALTEGLFSLFGAGDYLARLAPAFLGGLIVLVPFCFRERIGRLAALIFAGGLAVDPALVSISRIASGQVPGLVMLLLSLALLHQRKTPWAVFSFVIALFSGPTIWTGLLLIGITILISARVGWIDPRTYLKDRFGSLGGVEQRKTQGWEAYLLPGILILVIGSFFFREIQGLSAWTGSLGEYLVTWTNLPIFRSPEVLIHLGVSGPLILIFGALGLYRSWVDGEVLGKIASVWFGVGLLLLLVYPGRQPGDLIWLSLPLWLGSARELVRIYQLADDHWPIWSLAVLVGTLMILNWLTFTGMVFQGANPRAELLQLGLIAASLALALLAVFVVASEWSWQSALKGLGMGVAAMLLVYTLSATVQGAYLRKGDPRSLWTFGPGYGQINLLLDTVGGVGITLTGRQDSVEGVVLGDDETLSWYLRDFKSIEFLSSFPTDNPPPLVITNARDESHVPQDAYRGQDFMIRSWPAWPGLIPEDWISWIGYRLGPIQAEQVILWVRGDILAEGN